ncbi:phytoene desaturase family protein [Helicobacter anatolicus]|uniref:phytoene desaturase family protein n=1 Tax=Helicobacter anatolicus TaxID=2905874 RepID=UPI001E49A89A|nr:NAD(P)/FAD-dependent oxidoreductase [Helicobacter anatolicus]MCE3039093.1 NAD(P)/FAD-dependent oxidoreductase [Helicobacter anatolicus]
MQKYDAIIIGSGLGGLSSGATLAKAGKKVLVLEQHSLVGGCATCFKRKGMLVDAGLHEMDFGSEKRDIKHVVFKNLGLDKRLELITLPSAWSIIEQNRPNEVLTIPHGYTKEALIKAFPHEKEGIKKYFKKIAFQSFLVRKFPFDMKFLDFFFAPLTTLIFFAYNMFSNKSVGEVLNSCIKDSKLKRILNINISYYHHNPFKFIWSYHAIAQSNYYNRGVYIKGGSQKLSDSLSEIIRENGGEVLINADVVEILHEFRSAKGVRYINKKSGEEKKIFADVIIANCDPHIVYTKLLNLSVNEYRKDFKLTQDFLLTTSLVSLYMIFDKNLSEIYPNMDYSTFLVDEKYFHQSFDEKNTDSANIPIENRDFAFVNYSKINSGLSDRSDRYLGVGAVYSYYEEWENLDKEAYRAKKEELQNALVKRLERVYPGIMQYCIHIELATPKTIERYTRTRKGAIYGYDQDREGFIGRERFKSKSIKNLYFASAFGFPGGGFTGAILGGYRTAKKILDPYFYAKRITLCFIFGIAFSMGISTLLKVI